MKKHALYLSLAVLAVLGIVAGCTAAATPAVEPPTSTLQPATPEAVVTEMPDATEVVATPELIETLTEEAPAPTVEVPGWAADGVIGGDEYTDTADFGRVRLWWRHDGEFLYFAMEGDTQGWVSVGIEPTRAMKDADFLFGFVEGGEAKLWDAFGVGATGPTHPPDDEIGGANHILEFAGVETDNMTRFELKRLLDTGDAYDKALVPGNSYAIIIAIGNADDYDGYHSWVRSGQLQLQP